MIKKALITGSNTGIGFALSLALLKKGYHVISWCRKPEYFSLLHAEFSKVSDNFDLFASDFEQDFTSTLEEIVSKGLVPDVIINNAAIAIRDTGDFHKDQNGIERSMRVNVLAPMRICEFFASKMAELPWGRIINISSKMASLDDNKSGGSTPYRISKVALNMYTVNLAHKMSDTAIKVFAVHPGWIKTRMGGMMAPNEIEDSVPRILFTLSEDADSLHGKFLFGSEVLPW
ncbi:SDR family NAD(P)-dependent oxidoreductase [bacterium]|jgi:NAD(P)-dependent dehydrogenase (short-subunit alcohol dehydrogenase family)|nr:SDR family NAD(P)-dependent oxidoreductase [bacterium]